MVVYNIVLIKCQIWIKHFKNGSTVGNRSNVYRLFLMLIIMIKYPIFLVKQMYQLILITSIFAKMTKMKSIWIDNHFKKLF